MRSELIVSVLSGIIALHGLALRQPAPGTQIELLNRGGQPTTQITDGDMVKLRATLTSAGTAPQTLNFALSGDGTAVGSCTVPAGARLCETEAFYSLGWHWDTDGSPMDSRSIDAHDSNARILGQSGPITVLPRPVVLVHGFISSWETWQAYLGPDGFLAAEGVPAFAVGDGRVTGVLNTGSFTDPAGRTNTIAQNAAIEAQYIDGVKEATGAETVDLVVHSMGGMISRYYIDRVMGERDVAQLIMLGSPMGGSDCTALAASLGFYLPASIEIRQSYMEGIFNPEITHRHGVEFFDLGGTAILEAFKSPCTDVPNDSVVSFGSVNAIPLQSVEFEALHSDLTSSRPAFDTFVRPLLRKSAGQFVAASDPQSPSAASGPLNFTRVYTGHVEPGTSDELTINIEPELAVASFALYDPTRSVTVSVEGASGNTIELSPQTNGFIRVEDPSSMIYLGYGFSNPNPGPWKVTVSASSATPSGGADFAVSVYFVGGPTLDAQASTFIPSPGESVLFSASLLQDGQPLDIIQATAVVRHPDGTVEDLVFGAGKEISTMWTAQSAGTYGADIIVTGAGQDGVPIERTAFLALEVQPNPSRGRIITNVALAVCLLLLGLGILGFAVAWLLVRVFRHRPRPA